jgi:PTH1 family peptidyl-tRNA hydrolase
VQLAVIVDVIDFDEIIGVIFYKAYIFVNVLIVHLNGYPAFEMVLEMDIFDQLLTIVIHTDSIPRNKGLLYSITVDIGTKRLVTANKIKNKVNGSIREELGLKCFVGLGNPGPQYARTRHNIGFMAIDRFAEKWGISRFQSKCKALLGEGNVHGQKVFLLKPMTFMNLSGESVRAFIDFYKADLQDLIILYDDLDTPFGSLRLRYQGSAGGHNGIKSIIQHTGTQVFHRIRIGISRPAPGYDIADYVLSNFTGEETKQMDALLDTVCDAMEHLLQHPFEKTMAKFNG